MYEINEKKISKKEKNKMERTEFELFLMFLANIKKNADETFARTGSFRAKLISEHATIAREHAVLFKSYMEIKKKKQSTLTE